MVGRAAEKPQPGGVKRLGRLTGDCPAIDILHGGVVLGAAGFEQDHIHRRARQLFRKGQPGGAGPDNQEIGR
ncbi:MAG: hypothetical protein Tsb0010_09500 [Parvularculaceae bacterium]